MSRWHRLFALTAVLTVPALAAAQGRHRSGLIAPPIPDGPTLEMPTEQPLAVLAGDARPAAWLDSGDVIPAGVNDIPWLPPGQQRGPVEQIGHSTVGGAGLEAQSACHFDQWNDDGVFRCGTKSTQYLFGAYFSGRPGPIIPSFDYLLTTVRFGYMLDCPQDRLIGRGNYEFLVDLSAATIISGGYGDYFVGPSFLLRYNWVEPGATLVPYNQFGLGIVYTDAYKDRSQEAIGQQLEFYLRWQIGVRYFASPNLSFDAEIGLEHLSNAGYAERNLGANMFGIQFGMTYYFPWGGS
jgi:lipid A 3-O-deacylase